MDDGLRVSITGREVEIFQNAGDPDYPEDEISIKMSLDSFRKIVAICDLGTKKSSKPKASEHFDRFWQAYPKKTAKDKAERAWSAAEADKQVEQIMSALESMISCEQWTKDGGRFIPHASTWLNGRRWNDVVEPSSDLGQFK